MANLNKVVIVGRLVDNPEARVTVDGMPVTKFKLTVSSFGGQVTGSIDVVAWQKLAEVCGQYLTKNRLVLIEGRLQIRSFEDKGGQRKWVNEIVAGNMQMLDGKAETVKVEEPVSEEVEELPPGDLPF